MIRREREIPPETKLNLIPIMDAVFIFIFFLLFSAQFIKIFEIETDAPLVSQVPEETVLEKEPLNLTVKIFKTKVVIYTGIDQKEYKSYSKLKKSFELDIKADLILLRKKHPNESHAIVTPEPNTEYDEIIKTLDLVQKLPEGMDYFNVRIKGKEVMKSKIFNQIVLEPLDET
jgi:biopolymer transport protein ExbD